MKQVNFSIDERAFATLEKHAAQHGQKATSYAKLLFEAAFASRVGVQPDSDIDFQIATAIVLHGARKDSAAIAKAVRLSEPTVIRIIDAWRSERPAL
jgi:2-hydroxychromene-2-carboxylate isomerase